LEAKLAGQGCDVLAASPPTRSLLVRHAIALSGEQVRDLVAAALSGVAIDLEQPEGPRGETSCRPGADDDDLRQIARAPAMAALVRLGAAADGLSRDEAQLRLAKHGANALPIPKGRSRRDMILSQVSTFPVLLLLGSAALSVATGGLLDAAVTLGVVVANAAIGFSSENSTERLIRRLSRPIEHVAAVLRDGTVTLIPAREVVSGDVIVLAPGAHVVADARVIDARDLSIDESVLTGESLPVEKTAAALRRAPASVTDRRNIIHRGTVVTGGDGRAIVFRTGAETEIARTGALIGLARPPRPASEAELRELGGRMALVCLGAAGLVFAIGVSRGESLLAMAKSAIALAVAAVPEGLPAIATTTLAMGARAMEGERALVRVLPAVEAVGGVDTICLDKTGTVTENRMAVVAAHVGDRTHELAPGAAWAPTEPGLSALAETVVLCNEASLTSGSGSSTELALLEFADALGVDRRALRARLPKSAVRSRNHVRRWMATEHPHSDGVVIAVKGAPDEVLGLAERELVDGEERTLAPERRQQILAANEALARRGLRLLGVARRNGALGDGELADLTWLGLVALADPVRAEACEAVKIFHRAGIRTVMITGDQSATALAVAESLGLSRTGVLRVVEGAEIANLDEHALGEVALKTSVFARASPADKLRIVRALQSAGRRVAMIGDGVNDGPALRAAAVGVAMGRKGTDVAREVADIVIANDDLRQLARAIARGRATEDNLRTAIRYLVSTNLSELIVMLTESLHGAGELETPMELFWLNLATDVLPALGLSLAEPRGDVMARAPRTAADPLFTGREIASIGLDGAGIAAAALTAHFMALARSGPGPAARTPTFMTLAISQIAHAWVLRDRSPEAVQARTVSARRLNGLLAGAGAALALPLVASPLRTVLGLGPVTLGGVLASAALSGFSLAVAEGRRIMAEGKILSESARASQPVQTARAPGPRPVRAQVESLRRR
jgi:Ca2+-transporting ATPase